MSNGRKIADLVVGTNVKVTQIDSDLDNTISLLKTRLDSDDAKLQSLDTAINAGIVNLVDSDLIINQLQSKINSAISNVDSDSTALQAANTQIGLIKSRLDSDQGRVQALSTSLASEISSTNTDISAIKGRLDSDDGRLQALDSSITVLKSRLDSDETTIQSAKTLIGQAVSSQGMADSDLKVVADLRNQLDSEITYVRLITLSYVNYTYTATAGQTSFSGTDANSLTLAYTAGSIQVFLNGVKLEDEDYTATDGTTVVLTEGAQLGHQVTIIVPKFESGNAPVVLAWSSSSQQARIQSSDIATLDYFGSSVSISQDGNYAVVGAPDEGADGTQSGAAYIFIRSGSSWSQQTKLDITGHSFNVSASSNRAESHMGCDVAINAAGDLAVVGAKHWGNRTANGGDVFVFGRSGTTWTQHDTLWDFNTGNVYSQSSSTTGFGQSVDISNDGSRAVVGYENGNSLSAAGGAYVSLRMGKHWGMSANTNITASNKGAFDKAAAVVDISGDGKYIVMGARHEDDAGSQAGTAYIFKSFDSDNTHYKWTSGVPLVSTAFNALTNLTGIDFNDNGTKVYITGYSGTHGDSVAEYSLTIPYEISSRIDSPTKLDLTAAAPGDSANEGTYPTGLKFKPDGTKLYFAEATGTASSTYAVIEYTMSTAFDLSTASRTAARTPTQLNSNTNVQGVQFKPDGSKMYLSAATSNRIDQFDLSSNWDLSSASSSTSATLDVSAKITTPSGMEFNADGSIFFVTGGGGDKVIEYKLSTPYDISTATHITDRQIGAYESDPRCLKFHPDGRMLFISGVGGDDITVVNTSGLKFEETQKIVASDANAGDEFGANVAINQDGTVLAVSAPKRHSEDNSVTNVGKIYIFTKSGETWSEVASIEAQTNYTDLEFGTSLSINDDGTIVVAGARQDGGTATNGGAVYVIEGSDSSWQISNRIESDDVAANDYFGSHNYYALDISGDGNTLIAGAEKDSPNNTGSAYIFTNS